MKEAQGELKKTADTAQSNMDRMANAGRVAFAGIGVAAVGFGAVAVKTALEGQQAHAQLVQAVQNSGTAFSSVGGKVDEMSARFAKLGYENDAVEAALARLVQGTGNTKTAMDSMALAADIARARHMDLTEVAQGLGKILSGNMKGMVAFGLSSKDAAGNVLTTAAAMAELNSRFGGAAAAQAGTYAGKLQALNAEWHNMIESVGNMLLPVLGNLAGRMADVAGWFEKHRGVAIGLAAVIAGPLVLAMNAYIAKQAVAFVGSTIETVKKIGAAIMTILVPATEAEAVALTTAATAEAFLTAGLSVAAGAAAIAGVAFLSHATATTGADTAAATMTGTVDGLAGAEDGLGDSTTGAIGALKAQEDLFKQLNHDTAAQSGEIFKLIGDQQNLDRATKTLAGDTTAHAQAQQTATRAARELGDAQTKLTKATADYNKLQGGLGMEISLDQNHAHHDLEQAQLNHETAQTKLNDAVAQYGENSVEARQASLDLESATFTLQAAQGSMGDIGKSAWDKVNAAQDAVHQAQQDVIDKTNAQKDALDKMNKPASDLAANTLAWQQAQNTLNTDWEKFQGLLIAHPELRDQLAGQLQRMKDNLPKGADVKPLQDLLDKINAMDAAKIAALDIALLTGAASKDIGNLLGNTTTPPGPAAPKASRPDWTADITFSGGAAEGAVVRARPGGRLMLVGEGGKDEAIVPLDRAGAGLGNVIINVYGNGRTDAELALVLRDEILKAGRNMAGIGLG